MPVREEAAKRLAQAHFHYEPGITRIFRIGGSADMEARPNEPSKLLEVNENTIPSGIMPIGFDAIPARDIPLPSIIVEITPDEFEQVQAGTLRLPDNWQIQEELPRERVNGNP